MTGFSLRDLRDLCVSVVNGAPSAVSAETLREHQRSRRELCIECKRVLSRGFSCDFVDRLCWAKT